MDQDKIFHGPLRSEVAGRTDHLPVHTPQGGYILPADTVSHIGENNTEAGFKALNRLFKGIPYSNNPNPYGEDGPYGDPIQNRAAGGKTDAVPCVLAGGEYSVHPDIVRAIGEGDLSTGHAVLDEFVKRVRKEHIDTLKKLPSPKK